MATRKQIITAIRAAGAEDDSQAMLRLYAENRISYDVALRAYREGYKIANGVKRLKGET